MSFTWSDLKTEIEAQYDLSEETFITATELLVYVNDAIKDVEKSIHAIEGADKYFETVGYLSLTNGSAYVPLPTDIYANKIVLIYYNSGNTKYEIKPVKDLRMAQYIGDGEFYRYRIENSASSGTKIRLYPASAETNTTTVICYYIRKAATITQDTDVIDVPEPARNFIKQYVIDKAVNKERMTPDAPESAALKRERDDLVAILSSMIVDENNEVLPDLEHFADTV